MIQEETVNLSSLTQKAIPQPGSLRRAVEWGYGLYLFILSPQGNPPGHEFYQILDAQLKAVSQIASAQFSPLDNSATMTRQRRGACQPGATPRACVRVHLPPCKGGGDFCALAERTD